MKTEHFLLCLATVSYALIIQLPQKYKYDFHFDKVHSYCFRVPDLHEASMMLEAVGEKPRFSSCVLISDTSVMTFSGGEGVFRLDGLADIVLTRSLVALLDSELAFSLQPATKSVSATLV